MTELEKSLIDSPLARKAWRMRNLYTVVDDKARLVPFVPNEGQRQFYRCRHLCNHILKARKLGFSTFITLLNLDDLLFEPHLVAGIVDKGIDDAKKKLHMMRLAYQNLDNPDLHPDTWQLGALIKEAVPLVTDAKEELAWGNGSMAYCGTSLRGGTTNRLHISELGSIAIKAPQKAREIIEGAMNSFTPGNRADIESTHEGGKIGIHYNLLRQAMANDPERLTPVDFRFHFFPWWEDPRYVLNEPYLVQDHTQQYFRKLSAETGQAFSHGQMLWYERKSLQQGHGMLKEFPSTPGEAFEAISDGAIYGKEMANLRAGGRISSGWTAEPHHPLYTFWDIGLSDYTAIWLIQPIGRQILVLDWYEVEGRSAAYFADQLRVWESKWGRPIARNFLPHDANTRDRGTGKSYVDVLRECGMTNVSVVPRTPDIWISIGYVRDILPSCWFLADNCDVARNRDGRPYAAGAQQEEFPSGVACLEGYSRNVSATALREMPSHDHFSHSADAFRTFAEAWRKGMVNADATPSAPPRAIGGPRARR